MTNPIKNAVKFKFEPEKALEVILYIAHRANINDLYHVLKILYFADKEHLNNYGRFTCGDSYVAMKLGPVPSYTYDLIKFVRDEEWNYFDSDFVEKLKAVEYGYGDRIIARRDANMDCLSESDVKCLEKSIKENGSLGMNELKAKSHDEAFEVVEENDFMPVELIAKTLPNADKVLEYLHEFC